MTEKNLVLDTFVNFKPVERLKNGSNMSEFRNLDDSTSKRVGAYVVEILGDCNIKRCSSQFWSEQWQ